MAANSNIILSSLDFDTLKSNFITFLKSQTRFKDFNFSGDNINVLLDILSYNSYLNSFYLNMVASEMFLDSAQLLNSVVSHVKELNYLPRSSTSSAANVSFNLYASGISDPLIIPKGTTFAGLNSNGTFTFTTPATTSYNSNGIINGFNQYNINNLQIFEGSYVTDSFLMDYTQQNQQFILSNPNIDSSSLTVTVYETTNNYSNDGVFYNLAENLFGLDGNSVVYFIQGAQNGQYEILFGDNLFGHTPLNNSLITINYRIAAGKDADGISVFNLTYPLSTYNNGIVGVNGSITCISNSVGGTSQEALDSMKFNSPRWFAAQERGVVSDDYSALIMAEFGNLISDVNVYGGELLTPKQYGFVAICLQPSGGTIAPDYVKSQISNYLITRANLSTRTILTDPDYYYVSVNSIVNFNSTITSLNKSDIENEVTTTILEFSNNNLEAFKSNFKYSKFAAAIDETDYSIDSNDTTVMMIKRLTPSLNNNYSTIVNFNNEIHVESYLYQLANNTPGADEPSVFSTSFTFVDNNNNSYANSIIRDDNFGNLIIFSNQNGIISIVGSNVGTVNYITGQVNIQNLNISYYPNAYISLYSILETNDIKINQNQILEIASIDVNITAVDISEKI